MHGFAAMTTRTLLEIANSLGASIEGDPMLRIRGPASLRDAARDEISFCAHPRFHAELARTQAGAVLLPPGMPSPRPDLAVVRCADPSKDFTRVVLAFVPPPTPPTPGVHPSAIVEAGAELATDVSIGPYCRIGARARIRSGVRLHARVDVGDECEIGAGSELHPNVVLYPRVRIGERCVVHAGSVVGSDGHGFEPSAKGWIKVPQCGVVIVEDDVEIGANCTIDRARFGATRIGRGTKIDNLVHVAHNVVIGDGSMIVAQVGIAGSTRLGRHVVLGGQVGVGGHLDIGDRVQVGGQAGVTSDWEAGVELWGTPARPLQQTLRNMAGTARVDGLAKRLRALERRLDATLDHGKASGKELQS